MHMLSMEALRLHAQIFVANSLDVCRYGSDFYPGGDAMLNREINVYSAVGGGGYLN